MRFKHFFIFFSLFLFRFSVIDAQQHRDYLMPLKANPVLVNYTKQVKKNHGFIWRLISDSIVLKLPFLDDFSHGGPYPDTSLWVDNAAYINNTYPICPPTIGVATLDGVDNAGRPYNPSCPPGASYPADSLTSRPINMAQYLPPGTTGGDSVYLSFYWQAGGRGFAPLTSDTLLLQFRTASVPWTTVWYQLGYSPIAPDTGFHQVMILLLDTMHTIFYNPSNPNAPGGKFNPYDGNFQFRFKNYACTSANADQWNIDDVYLNKNRTYADTLQNNTSFVYESASLLANYQYMPWEQFTDNDLVDTMYVPERYNAPPTGPFNVANIAYNYVIPSDAVSYAAFSHNIISFYLDGYNTYNGHTHIPIKSHFNYTPLTGPTSYTLTQYITNTSQPNALKWDDTLKFKQIFSNYYAYDDSTAEASYFINGTTPMELAEEFTLNNQDTLRGLELYFNYMFVDPANYNMVLAVWADNAASPGTIIFQDDTVATPRTSDSLNGYTYYPFHSSSPIVINAGQTIYVGWIQTNGDSLNLGFDLNTNSQNKIFYNANVFPGGWQPGDYGGSLMMRPVFGSVGFKFHAPLTTGDIQSPIETLGLYPNPANDMVTLTESMPPNTTLKVYTADGKEYMSNHNFYGNSINTSTLPTGFYIVEVSPQGGQTSYQKLLIQR